MSDQYESVQDLTAKVDYEGGVAEAIIGYGISASRLPEGVPADVVASWERVYSLSGDVDLISRWLDSIGGDDRDEC